MRRRRPGIITTFAILNFIFGSLFLLCGASGFSEAKIESNNVDYTQPLKDTLKSEVPAYTAWKYGGSVLQLLLAAGIIASGVGMLQLAGWGRLAAMACAGGFLLLQLINVIYQFALVNPTINNFVTTNRVNFGGLLTFFMTVGTIITTILVFAYCSILLIVLVRSGRVFSPDYKGEPEDDRPRRRERDDDEDDDRPRRRSRSEDADEDDRPRRPRRRDEGIEDEPRRRPRPPRDDDE